MRITEAFNNYLKYRINAGKMTFNSTSVTDRQTRQQMVIVVRCVTCKGNGSYVWEDPFAVDIVEKAAYVCDSSDGNELVKLNGVTLGKIIVSEIDEAMVDVKQCIGQGCDGAAALSCTAPGAADRMKDSLTQRTSTVSLTHLTCHGGNA